MAMISKREGMLHLRADANEEARTAQRWSEVMKSALTDIFA